LPTVIYECFDRVFEDGQKMGFVFQAEELMLDVQGHFSTGVLEAERRGALHSTGA